ncbi:MAG: hypothetical protein SGILL_008012, partial [Bacillariaceae sp.]
KLNYTVGPITGPNGGEQWIPKHFAPPQPIAGVWIGGSQSESSRNDTEGGQEKDVVWTWNDGSLWFDNNGEYWKDGEPDNKVDTLNITDQNRTVTPKGEHHVLLDMNGEYISEHGCTGSLAPPAPGIYILPSDYNDTEKYLDCSIELYDLFLHDQSIPVPKRPNPDFLYVLDTSLTKFCSLEEKAVECGGHLASIGSVQEKAIVDILMAQGIEFAEQDSNLPDIDSVWIGGKQIAGIEDGNLKDLNGNTHTESYIEDESLWVSVEEPNATWGWTDGSPWFDNNGTYWAPGQPDNIIFPYRDGTMTGGEDVVRLRADGLFEDRISCQTFDAPSFRFAAGVYRLPFDFEDRSKYPKCEHGNFLFTMPAPPR